jgi:hypothetical protein
MSLHADRRFVFAKVNGGEAANARLSKPAPPHCDHECDDEDDDDEYYDGLE